MYTLERTQYTTYPLTLHPCSYSRIYVLSYSNTFTQHIYTTTHNVHMHTRYDVHKVDVYVHVLTSHTTFISVHVYTQYSHNVHTTSTH